MKKIRIETPSGPPARGAYSAAIRAGDFVYVAGQSARGKDLTIIGETIEEQTRVTLRNVEAILRDAGATLGDVVKATVHLSDLTMFSRYNAVYAELMPEPRPVRTTVGSVLAPDIMVEIDVVAYAPSAD